MKTKLMQLADAYASIPGDTYYMDTKADARAALEAEIDRVTAERDKLAAELKALRDNKVALPKPVAWRFNRPGISKLDAWPHGGDWERLYTESDTRDYGDRRAMAERERCAKVCDLLGGDIDQRDPDEVALAANSLAEAIRKGEKS